MIDRAIELKRLQRDGALYEPLKNRTLAMIFQLSSTRTRVAFEAGMQQLGGHAIFLSPDDTQLGRGEPIEDTARVLSGMVDVVMIRTTSHADVEAFAAASSVPVINAMSSKFHPCQLLADVQTFVEQRGEISRTRSRIPRRRLQHVQLVHQCRSPVRLQFTHRFTRRIPTQPRIGR